MSRYGFNVDDVEIVVGWDNPIQTFFGSTEVDGEIVVDTMISMGQFDVQDVHLLECMIGFSAPDDIRSKLVQDRNNATSPTEWQERTGRHFRSRAGE